MSKHLNMDISFGGGFVSLLQVAFIVLKLLNQIDWPWLWVLAPIWISASIVALVLLVIALVYLATR
jgi:hypothetical protein